MFFLAPFLAPDCDYLSHPAIEEARRLQVCCENALAARSLPRNHGQRTIRFERPDKLQKRCRFIVELSVKPADSRKALFSEWQLPFSDSTLHATPATSTTHTSSW